MNLIFKYALGLFALNVAAQAAAQITFYEGEGFRPYTNSVYFQGAKFLENVRTRIGDEAFFAFIQDYVNQGRGKIVTANDFFRILLAHTGTDISDLINQYFRSVYQ